MVFHWRKAWHVPAQLKRMIKQLCQQPGEIVTKALNTFASALSVKLNRGISFGYSGTDCGA